MKVFADCVPFIKLVSVDVYIYIHVYKQVYVDKYIGIHTYFFNLFLQCRGWPYLWSCRGSWTSYVRPSLLVAPPGFP